MKKKNKNRKIKKKELLAFASMVHSLIVYGQDEKTGLHYELRFQKEAPEQK